MVAIGKYKADCPKCGYGLKGTKIVKWGDKWGHLYCPKNEAEYVQQIHENDPSYVAPVESETSKYLDEAWDQFSPHGFLSEPEPTPTHTEHVHTNIIDPKKKAKQFEQVNSILDELTEIDTVDDLPGMWDKSDFTGGQTDEPADPNTLLKSLQEQIKALQAQVETLKYEKLLPVEQKFDLLKEEEAAIYQEFHKKLLEVQAQQDLEYSKKLDLEKKIHENENLIGDLIAKQASMAEALAAQQKIEKLRDEVGEFFKTTKWGPHILDFQIEDVMSLVEAFDDGLSGVLNANVMGAGKTFETVAALTIIRDRFFKQHGRLPRIIWVTSKSLVHATMREINNWDDTLKPVVIEGAPGVRDFMVNNLCIPNNLMVIINYDGLTSTPAIREHSWDIVVYDEVSALKNGEKTLRFQNAKTLLEGTKFFLPISGTPIENKPEDVWAYLHLFQPQRFPSVNKFKYEYVRERWDETLGRYTSRVNMDKLIKVLGKQIIRQDKEVIYASRPSKDVEEVWTEYTPKQEEVIKKIGQGVIEYLDQQEQEGKQISITAVIAQLNYWRQASVWPAGIKVHNKETGAFWEVDVHESGKINAAMQLIEELNAEGEQVVVWSSQFKAPLYEIQRRCKEEGISCAVITADESDQIGSLEEMFQNGDIDVLAVNMMKGAHGLNLHKNPARWKGGARNAIFLDLWWNPAKNSQAEDRIWREGTKERVTIYRILVDQSIDNLILSILDEKQDIADGVVEREELRPAGDWKNMLKSYLENS